MRVYVGQMVRFFTPWIGYEQGQVISVDESREEALLSVKKATGETASQWVEFKRLTVIE